jgi:hypothetical protein
MRISRGPFGDSLPSTYQQRSRSVDSAGVLLRVGLTRPACLTDDDSAI